MKTRLRELRKQRNLTLKQMADLVGTTPQTVQRLETANMRVSVDWLTRFATALGVEAAELMVGDASRRIPLYALDYGGRPLIIPRGLDDSELVGIDVPARNPVAVSLARPLGPFRQGCLLIGDRLQAPCWLRANGRRSIVALRSGNTMLGQTLWNRESWVVAPLDDREQPTFDVCADWIAPIVMEVNYY